MAHNPLGDKPRLRFDGLATKIEIVVLDGEEVVHRFPMTTSAARFMAAQFVEWADLIEAGINPAEWY